LGKYLGNTLHESEQNERRRALEAWVNSHSKGLDCFTPLHFASFHGNLYLIQLLREHGADLTAKNNQNINMLHVAAQGDQPASLYYFMKYGGLDISSQDIKQSTPLHWAAFSGAELALSYIVAWDPQVSGKDSKGLTPLHLAVKSSEDNSSSRSIR